MAQRGGVDGQLGREGVGEPTAFTSDARAHRAGLPGPGHGPCCPGTPTGPWASREGDLQANTPRAPSSSHHPSVGPPGGKAALSLAGLAQGESTGTDHTRVQWGWCVGSQQVPPAATGEASVAASPQGGGRAASRSGLHG
uniref:Uncharacterized protein n=1 Tax=Myotis myotis TaxID=51298 RepID=A0A7J7RH36_MYOMY|nr:hypothetical protein mMyoMyo1_010317 [Myotis myotis]